MSDAKAELVFKDRCPLCPLLPGLLPPFATRKEKNRVAMPQRCSGYLTHWYIRRTV